MKFNNLFFLGILIFCSVNIYAGIRPSFDLNYSAWEATDIVVTTEGDTIDGNFIVLESLKGDLSPAEIVPVPELIDVKSKASDEILFIPELANLEPLSTRLVKFAFGENSQEPSQYVSGQRMILFLKRKTQVQNPNTKISKAAISPVWESASYYKEMNVSVVWLEKEKSFAFIQIINPGESILTEYNKSEPQIKEIISEVNRTQTILNQIIAIPDKAVRAEVLVPFTSSELFLARSLAFEELQKCGEAALPVLRRMLKDDSKLNLHGEVIETMTLIGGKKIGRDLTEIVSEEMAFWKATAPRLKTGWWNEINEPETEILRNRYTKVLEAIHSIRKIKFVESKETVIEFRDFWRSLPQLEDKGGLDQMSEACNDVLNEMFKR